MKYVGVGATTPEKERRGCVVLTPKTGFAEYAQKLSHNQKFDEGKKGGIEMGEKIKGKKEQKKQAQLSLKDKRKLKKEKKKG